MTGRASGEGPRGRVSAGAVAAYITAAFLMTVAQITLCPRVALFGVAPQITLALVCAAAYFSGPKTGALLGIGSGFLLDALVGNRLSLLAVFYFLVGWIIGSVTVDARHRQQGRLGGWSLWLGVGVGAGMVITAAMMTATTGRADIISMLLYMVLPQALNTYLWGWPIGLVCLLVSRKRRERAQ